MNSKTLMLTLAALIGLSDSGFAQAITEDTAAANPEQLTELIAGKPTAEAAAIAARVLSKAILANGDVRIIAQIGRNAISNTADADKAAMAETVAATGKDAGDSIRVTISAAAIAAAGRTGAGAEAVALGLVKGAGAANVSPVVAAIKLAAGNGGGASAVVTAAIASATALGAGEAARTAAQNATGTLGTTLSTSVVKTASDAHTDNTGELTPKGKDYKGI